MDQDSGRKSKTSPKVRHICLEFEKQPSNVACILSFFHIDVGQCTYLLMYVSVCCMRYTQGQAKSSYQAKREPLSLCSSFLLEERCRFLSNFTTSTAEVELPGEFLMPKLNTVS